MMPGWFQFYKTREDHSSSDDPLQMTGWQLYKKYGSWNQVLREMSKLPECHKVKGLTAIDTILWNAKMEELKNEQDNSENT